MRVRVRHFLLTEVPPEIENTVRQFFMTPGAEYEVHAVAVFKGATYLQVVNDQRHIDWLRDWVFDVTDPAIPTDWIVNLFRDDNPTLIAGPEFVAKSIAAYDAMVELDDEQNDLFWARLKSREAAR